MFQVRTHDNLVIIVHRSLVAAAGIDDGDEAVVLGFHLFIGEAKLAQQFDASYFEPDKVVRVIDHTHLIGFGVSDANAGFVYRRAGLGRGQCNVLAHWPVHFGLRFSRNDVMPSRKSAVARMPAFSWMAASICESSSARAWSVSRRFV